MFNAPVFLNSAANRNTWQYDLSTSMPNDYLGALNDSSIWNYSAKVGGLFDSTAMMQMQSVPMMTNFYAQIAQMWQDMMTKMQETYPGLSIKTPTISGATGKAGQKIAEGKIIAMLEKMGTGTAVADRINQEIEVNGQKTTILRRLISLVSDYRKDPENAELSEANYEKIWEIADKYAKTGDVSSADFAILREIIANPAGEDADAEEDDEEIQETPLSDVLKEKKENPAYKEGVKNAAECFKTALYDGWGTKHEQLSNAINSCNADNIVEVYERFYKDHGINEGETLADAIYADFDDWTNKWYGLKGSASTFLNLHDILVERAENHIANYGDTADKDLQKAIDLFKTNFSSINDENYDSKKAEISKMFSDMVKAIKKAEATKIAEEQAE